MGYRNFRLNIVARAAIIFALFFSLFTSMHRNEWYVTSVVLGFIILLAFVELIRYVERTNRQFTSFLTNIKNRDFSSNPSKVSGKSFAKLSKAYELIYNEFQDIKIEKEVHYQYLQILLAQIDIAIVCFASNGKVAFYNKAAQNLFSKHLKNVEDFKQIDIGLCNLVQTISPKQNKIFKMNKDNSILQLSIDCSEFKIEKELFRLLSFKNIKNELEDKELESWQMLIRIISHEIMNSTTPIISMTEALKEILFDESNNVVPLMEIDNEDAAEIYEGVEVMHRKSVNMQQFVQAYKNLTRIPQPQFTSFSIKDFLKEIELLFKAEMQSKGIAFFAITNRHFHITADKGQMEQVLVNIIRNAIDALSATKDAKLTISAIQNERVTIEIENNGGQIEEEALKNMFIPFYTTKPKGSGIGLTVCRQIIRLHGGQIAVSSNNERTSFKISL